ncbi:MAG: hypothetical protein ACTSR8_16365 [Promethearchaeota archaeon]
MSVDPEVKKEFLQGFQKKIIQGRRLLQIGNHKWGDYVLENLYFDIEKTDWLDAQKKHQLIMIISNSWWIYLNSLVSRDDSGVKMDIIKYIDAYKRFFSFLSKLDDFYLFNNFCTNLLESFLKMDNLSLDGITKYINSFSQKLRDRDDFLKLIELQILLMYIRKSVIPTELYHQSMEVLGKILIKLEPGKRPLFLYIFLEDINLKYKLIKDSNEFVKEVQKILVNRLPSYLKGEFANLGKISINERNFKIILEDLEELVYYLNNISEYSWIITIIRNLFYKIQQFQSFGDAIAYIRKYIDFALSRNRFEIAYDIYDFLEDLFMFQTDLGYDNVLIELWVEACKKFVDMKEKKYLLQSLEKLNTHLKLPQSNAQIFHYFYTSNYLWQFKSRFFSLESRDFWRMMFYRALFEERDVILASNILPYLDKNIRSNITDINALYNEGDTLKEQIYKFEDEEEASCVIDEHFIINQMILRINSEGSIKYRMISLNNLIVEGKVQHEYWNDVQILEIYDELFSDKKEKKFNFTLNEFGRIVYLFIPKIIRDFFKQVKIASLDYVPQIFFILDHMTIPFELIFDNNFFLLKYSSAYKIGEASLGGVSFEPAMQQLLQTAQDIYNILIIDAINAIGPLKWNDEHQKKELIFPFPAGANELNYITNFFNNSREVNQINLLSGSNATLENILLNIREGAYHIIHFVGNVFYSKWSPKDSFFLTNDNNIVTFNNIMATLKENKSGLQPFLFFNTQLYDVEGKRLKNVLKHFGEIVEQFNYDSIVGILSRSNPVFNDETKDIIANFYTNLFKGNSQGVALLKARQNCMARKAFRQAELQANSLGPEGGTNISIENSLAISSFVLFGKPWKKL